MSTSYLSVYDTLRYSQVLGISSGDLTAIINGQAVQGQLLDNFKLSSDVDDTNALNRAIGNNIPVFLGARTYSISGITASNTSAPFVLIGIPGQSIIQRTSAVGGAFIQINSPSVHIEGVTFDMNSSSVSANQWGVLIKSTVAQTVKVIHNKFMNNSGTVGGGLALTGNGTNTAVVGGFEIRGNEFTNFTWNACFVGSVQNGLITGNYVHDCNTSSCAGISVSSYGTVSSTNYARDIIISNNRVERCWRGITAGGSIPPYTLGTPYASHISIIGNLLQDISNYAIVGQGEHIDTIANRINQSTSVPSVFTGIGYYGRYGMIVDNELVYSGSSYGIDTGGCNDLVLSDNRLNIDSGVGINCGGGQNITVKGNTINGTNTSTAITVLEVEGDGNGTAFPNFCSNLIIDSNVINRTGGSTSGINTYDNPGGRTGAQPTRITNNRFYNVGGASQSTCLSLTGGGVGAYIKGNTVNNTDTMFVNPNGSLDIVYNEVFDVVATFAGSNTKIRAIVPDLINTYNAGNSVLWVYPTANGTGYTSNTTLAATGSSGSGWAGTPLINNGQIVGVKTTNKGTGYSGTITVAATDNGGGTGATFSVTNFPVPYYNREITLIPSSVNNVVQKSGGALSIYNADYSIIVRVGDVLKLRAGRNVTKWLIDYEPRAVYTVSALLALSPRSDYNGCTAIVTGSTTSKWEARCDGTNWIWSDGTTVTT